MGSLFTEQIKERELADQKLFQEANEQIDEAAKHSASRDVMGMLRTNDDAVKRILSLCGIDEDNPDRLIKRDDILFSSIEGDREWYKNQAGYYIGVDDKGKYYAIIPGNIRAYYYIDEKGRTHGISGKNAGMFVKVYSLCRVLPKEINSTGMFLKYILSYMRRNVIALYIGISFLSGFLGLAFPRAISILLATIERGKDADWQRIAMISAWCMSIELVRLLLGVCLSVLIVKFQNMVKYNVKNAVLERYLSNAASINKKAGSEEVWAAINTSIPQYIDDLLSEGLSIIPNMVFTVFCLIAIACYLRQTSLWMVMVLLLLAGVKWIVDNRFDHWTTKALRKRIKGDHVLLQAYKGIEKIWSRQAQKRFYYNWSKIYAKEANCDKERKTIIAQILAINDFITPLLSVILIVAIVYVDIPYANLVTGSLLAGFLAAQVTALTNSSSVIFNTKSLWGSFSFLLERSDDSENKVKCKEFVPRLSVNRLSFAYPGMDLILNDISFEVKEGEYVGIVGLSGCGKSTILKLILGMLTPKKGEISYGTYDLAWTDHRSIFRNMGIVMQGETLIPGTIRQNMMMQPGPVTEEEIWETLEKVGIAGLVRNYPHGLDTEIGMSGIMMSGGQMQKLLIARAIISKPRMIILDEATSALDNVSQREIKDVLDSMKCTKIVVAHRLSTVQDCDRLLVIDNGMIRSQGTYEELLHTDDLFRELVQCQRAD